MVLMKSKFIKKREPQNRKNPMACKLRGAQFKPRIIRNKKKDPPPIDDLGD